MKKRYTFTNVELLNKLEEQNRSIVLMSSHYGSWEWIFILQTYVKAEGYAVYKRLTNKYFDALIKRIRARYNSYLVSNKEIIPTLLRLKNEGKLSISGFIADQSPKASKAFHWIDFMGIKVPVHTGAEMIAKRLDMSVIFFGVKKIKRGYYQTTFTTLAEDPKQFENYEITDHFFKLVEAQIREEPEYYLWTHKRWKHRNKVPDAFK